MITGVLDDGHGLAVAAYSIYFLLIHGCRQSKVAIDASAQAQIAGYTSNLRTRSETAKYCPRPAHRRSAFTCRTRSLRQPTSACASSLPRSTSRNSSCCEFEAAQLNKVYALRGDGAGFAAVRLTRYWRGGGNLGWRSKQGESSRKKCQRVQYKRSR